MTFTYAEMTTRNIGFVSPAEQDVLRGATVFVCGAGGMGGACLQSLSRAGVGGFRIADFDAFEVSNLNRQVFSGVSVLGRAKVEVAAERLRDVNPEVRVEIHGADWTERLSRMLEGVKVAVNGMDDARAAIELYRRAGELGVTVVDAYTSVLPSVYVTRPGDPRPEDRLGFGTRGTPWRLLTDEHMSRARMREIEYVLTHSTTLQHLDRLTLIEVLAGTRPRISFAPMVLTAGNLMAYEVIAALTGKPRSADCRGYFFNPYTAEVERPLSGATEAERAEAARTFLSSLSLSRSEVPSRQERP